MAEKLKAFPEKMPNRLANSRVSKLAKFCDGQVWKITEQDAKKFGMASLESLKCAISVRAGRYGRGTRMRNIPGGLAIQVLSEQETLARNARRDAAKAWNTFRRLQQKQLG